MKRSLSLLCLMLILGWLPASAAQKAASIVFDSITKDFNKITEGEVIRHVFKFTNHGNDALEIIRVDASCGCTTALLSAKMIPPGKSGEIEVKIETKDLNTAELSKTISVVTNDPKQPQIVLTVTAKVEQEFTLSENSGIFFGSVPRGQEVSKEILITIAPGQALKLLGVSSTDANVTVKLDPVAAGDGRQFKLLAVQKADTVEGYHFGTIVIKTTSQLKPELKIPVRGIILKGK